VAALADARVPVGTRVNAWSSAKRHNAAARIARGAKKVVEELGHDLRGCELGIVSALGAALYDVTRLDAGASLPIPLGDALGDVFAHALVCALDANNVAAARALGDTAESVGLNVADLLAREVHLAGETVCVFHAAFLFCGPVDDFDDDAVGDLYMGDGVLRRDVNGDVLEWLLGYVDPHACRGADSLAEVVDYARTAYPDAVAVAVGAMLRAGCFDAPAM
jgi:hypothetical protein